jgi:hypothetical protein
MGHNSVVLTDGDRPLGFASGVHKAWQLGRFDQRRGGQRLSSSLRQVSEH